MDETPAVLRSISVLLNVDANAIPMSDSAGPLRILSATRNTFLARAVSLPSSAACSARFDPVAHRSANLAAILSACAVFSQRLETFQASIIPHFIRVSAPITFPASCPIASACLFGGSAIILSHSCFRALLTASHIPEKPFFSTKS